METTTAQELIELEEQFGAHNYHPLDVVIERAQGVWVYDTRASAISIAWRRIRR